ncbi:hypothetical protein P691DRAFT_847629 [Macrolepiota fuliginosa MF-IS2]|uniref:NACHT domain-containing protein n=1 Tax=Macrolepiota fuliginosa MF-IS2 TaxID=1400762 RepID=A0A9P5X375_9AGAR|nr:hypothetical protein P691DRAFT_847629 [Macrolepiota fuliginosa MF-IS2]
MEFLANRGTIDATLTATARYPPPECHAETRLGLRNRIMTWFRDPDRDSNLLWLRGPAGVGKSAVAQTIAQECKNQGLLVATFFFSRPNNRIDPDCVIPTLAYQLATENLSYRHAITSLIIKDPKFFGNALPTQFQRLIVDLLSSCDHSSTSGPILIVLDGLDECHSDDSQKDFIKLVTTFAAECRKEDLPYVWIITSRPEWQIVSTFDQLQGPGQYHEERLHVHDPESQRDVERVLRDGFREIRQKYRDSFTEGEPWPGEAQIRVVSEMASGHFAFADTLVKFVGNAVVEDPIDQLAICLDFLQGNHVPEGGANPLDPLTLLYRGILQTVHKMHRHNAILTLATSFLRTRKWGFGGVSASIGDIVNFLFLDKGKFHRSLRKLHSVVSVPSAEHPDQPLEVYHRSFSDFTQQICRTGEFGITELDIMKTWWKCIAGWCRITGHRWKTMGYRMGAASGTIYLYGWSDLSKLDILGAMKWPNQHSQKHLENLAAALEQIWRNPSDEIISAVINDIHGVDFGYLWAHLYSDGLPNMIFKLHSWVCQVNCISFYNITNSCSKRKIPGSLLLITISVRGTHHSYPSLHNPPVSASLAVYLGASNSI